MKIIRLSFLCILSVLILSVFFCADSNAQWLNLRDTDNPEGSGVLILDATDEFRARGCKKILIWDDAAVSYYANHSIPSKYCKLQPGIKAIPLLEETRRKRGLPPGSYQSLYQEIERLDSDINQKIERLEGDIKRKSEESRHLKDKINEMKKNMARDPEYKRAMEGINSLFKYNILGVMCNKDFSALTGCSSGEYAPPVSREECIKLFKKEGYEDPCPALGKYN